MDALMSFNFRKPDESGLISAGDGTIKIHNIIPFMVRKSLLKGENYVGIVTGRTRSGKSFTALRICSEIDPNFSVDRVVFSAQEFMELLNSKTLNAGDMILWDEAGVGIATRDWYSILNKSINYVLQTWGHQNIGLILTVPDFSFVDSQTRKLCNMWFKTVRLIRTQNKSRLKVYHITPMKNDIKMVRPRYTIGDKKYDIDYIEVKKPNAKLVNAYLKKKENFTMKLNEEVQADIKKFEESKKREINRAISDEELLELAWEKLKDKISVKKGKRFLSLYIVRKNFNISMERARYVKDKMIERADKEDYPPLESQENVIKSFKKPEDTNPVSMLDPKNFI